MRLHPLSWFVVAVAAIVVQGAGGCGGSGGGGQMCATGQERCACYGNRTCNAGLVCRSDRCVFDPASGGATGSGGKGGMGAGGSPGTGGDGTAGQTGEAGMGGMVTGAAGTGGMKAGNAGTGGMTSGAAGTGGTTTGGAGAGGAATGGRGGSGTAGTAMGGRGGTGTAGTAAGGRGGGTAGATGGAGAGGSSAGGRGGATAGTTGTAGTGGTAGTVARCTPGVGGRAFMCGPAIASGAAGRSMSSPWARTARSAGGSTPPAGARGSCFRAPRRSPPTSTSPRWGSRLSICSGSARRATSSTNTTRRATGWPPGRTSAPESPRSRPLCTASRPR